MTNDSRTVIVTGASRGLGAAVAHMAAQMDANVVINARSEEALTAVAEDIRGAGGEVALVAGDVSEPEVYTRLVAEAVTRFGRVDALVNNAGILEPLAKVGEAQHDAWAQNLHVNVLAPVMLTRAALPQLRANGGRVINVSSGAATRPIVGWGAYCVSKAALNHYTRMIAAEEENVIAVAVAPGVVDTEMQAAIREQGDGIMPQESYQRFIDYHEQGELLDPETPGRALAALALHAPPDLNGETIRWNDERVEALLASLEG